MATDETSDEIKVLVTGFGEFLDIKTNPSGEIISLLPTNITSHSLPQPIRIITAPSPLKAAYNSLLITIPPLLENHNPDFIIHIGLAVERDYFTIEKGAERDGYHQFPDEERKVVSRAEGKRLWGKSPPRLDSVVNVEEVLGKWQSNFKIGQEKGKGKKGGGKVKEVDLRTTDDVGSYVCGFVYYLSLEWLWKRKREANVLFFHVPGLKSQEQVDIGRDVTVALIKAVVESSGKY